MEKIRNTITLKEDLEGDFEAAVADLRYKYITASCKGAIKHNRKSNELTKSDKIDKVLTNRWIGIPIFLVFMFIAFHLIFTEDLLFLNKFGVLEEGFCHQVYGYKVL